MRWLGNAINRRTGQSLRELPTRGQSIGNVLIVICACVLCFSGYERLPKEDAVMRIDKLAPYQMNRRQRDAAMSQAPVHFTQDPGGLRQSRRKRTRSRTRGPWPVAINRTTGGQARRIVRHRNPQGTLESKRNPVARRQALYDIVDQLPDVPPTPLLGVA